MAIAFNIVMHALLIVSMLSFLAALVSMVVRTDDQAERLRRSLALFAGAMVIIGAQASGVSFALFSTGALGTARGASLAANVVSSVIPALAGVGLGFYAVRVYRRSDARAMRIVCFIGMLALAAFAEVYAQATNTNGVLLGAAALPNLTFTVGVVLVFIFGDTAAEKRARGPATVSNLVQSKVRERLGLGSPTPAVAPQETPARHDPFNF